MKVAIYTRISTSDSRQESANQTIALKAHCEKVGWTIVRHFSDTMSGTKANRPGFIEMMEAAKNPIRDFDCIAFWSLDRLSRQGALPVLMILNQLSEHGVKFFSLQEVWLNSLGEFSDAIVGLLATIGSFEARRISQRVKAGLDRVRSQGKHLGRPKAIVDRDRLVEMRQRGMSIREIAKAVEKSPMTVQRLLRTLAA